MESVGVTLVKGELTGIMRVRKLSKITMANIKQNFFFAFIYNDLGVTVAAGGSTYLGECCQSITRVSHTLSA